MVYIYCQVETVLVRHVPWLQMFPSSGRCAVNSAQHLRLNVGLTEYCSPGTGAVCKEVKPVARPHITASTSTPAAGLSVLSALQQKHAEKGIQITL